jgi:hypothetical protein
VFINNLIGVNDVEAITIKFDSYLSEDDKRRIKKQSEVIINGVKIADCNINVMDRKDQHIQTDYYKWAKRKVKR